MRVLLDECLPRKFGVLLEGHDVRFVQSEGWSGIKNGELLGRAEKAGFQAFMTADRSVPYQQNYKNRSIGIIVLSARSNQLEDLAPLIAYVLKALQTIKPGEVVVIGM